MSVRIKHAVWTLVPVLGLAVPAFSQAASTPRYTYMEGGYVHVDFDKFNEDGDGFQVGGSMAIHPNFHVVADYQDTNLGGSLDASVFDIGIGGNAPLRPGLDLVGRVKWVHEEIDVGNSNQSDDGYGLEAAMRVMINPQLELNGTLRYVDIFNDDNTSFTIGGLYEVVNNLAVGGDIELSSDVTSLFLKARYYFGGMRMGQGR